MLHDLATTKFWHVFFPFPESSPETGSCFNMEIFFLFHALNSSRFRSALRKREKNVSAIYVFHYNNKRWVCIALWIPKIFVIMLTGILFFICQTWQKCVLIFTILCMTLLVRVSNCSCGYPDSWFRINKVLTCFLPVSGELSGNGKLFWHGNFFFLFHALNSSRLRSALRKREKNISAFYVFHYNNKRWVCIALWIPKNFRYHANRNFVFHLSDLTEMFWFL